jgi:flagellar L-ring protein FlgH
MTLRVRRCEGATVRGCEGAAVRRCAVLVVLLIATPAMAQTRLQSSTPAAASRVEKSDKAQQPAKPEKPSDNYDELYQRYLAAARMQPTTASAPDPNWMTGLMSDLRARRVNDLVTVRVVESVSAVGSADASLDKDSSASASLTKLFGLETKFPGWLDPTSLAAANSNTTFKGGGQTQRAGELTATISARVVEVLPNGDLALEGVREVDINGDLQMIVLSGVVRTADIGPGNVVPSTAIGQMRIRYFGRGLIKDNLQPGWVVRIINKIF